MRVRCRSGGAPHRQPRRRMSPRRASGRVQDGFRAPGRRIGGERHRALARTCRPSSARSDAACCGPARRRRAPCDRERRRHVPAPAGGVGNEVRYERRTCEPCRRSPPSPASDDVQPDEQRDRDEAGQSDGPVEAHARSLQRNTATSRSESRSIERVGCATPALIRSRATAVRSPAATVTAAASRRWCRPATRSRSRDRPATPVARWYPAGGNGRVRSSLTGLCGYLPDTLVLTCTHRSLQLHDRA